jgi:hypothetical protein
MLLLQLTNRDQSPLWVGLDSFVFAEPGGDGFTVVMLTSGPVLVRENLSAIARQLPRGAAGRPRAMHLRHAPSGRPVTDVLVHLAHVVTASQSATRNVLILTGGAIISTPDRVGPLMARGDADA